MALVNGIRVFPQAAASAQASTTATASTASPAYTRKVEIGVGPEVGANIGTGDEGHKGWLAGVRGNAVLPFYNRWFGDLAIRLGTSSASNDGNTPGGERWESTIKPHLSVGLDVGVGFYILKDFSATVGLGWAYQYLTSAKNNYEDVPQFTADECPDGIGRQQCEGEPAAGPRQAKEGSTGLQNPGDGNAIDAEGGDIHKVAGTVRAAYDINDRLQFSLNFRPGRVWGDPTKGSGVSYTEYALVGGLTYYFGETNKGRRYIPGAVPAKSAEGKEPTEKVSGEPPVEGVLMMVAPASGTVLNATEGVESKFEFAFSKPANVNWVVKDSKGTAVATGEAAGGRELEVSFTPGAPGAYSLSIFEGENSTAFAIYPVNVEMSEATKKDIQEAQNYEAMKAKSAEELKELAKKIQALEDDNSKRAKFNYLAAALGKVTGVKDVNRDETLGTIRFTVSHPNTKGMGSLDDGTKTVLTKIAAIFLPDAYVPGVEYMKIADHTDASGKAEKNQQLSEARAKLAQQHLEENEKTLVGKITAEGRGESQIPPDVPKKKSAQNDSKLKRFEFEIKPQLVKSAAEPPSPPATAPAPETELPLQSAPAQQGSGDVDLEEFLKPVSKPK